ncbi:MAG TPA: sialidase family protein [Candidatus Thermoplasmatota archaeon]|nr:sialidase family protein [Candidatus Thermoplasmatota archaeon]
MPGFGAPVAVSTEWPGAEPVIASASDGTLYIEGLGGSAQGNVNKAWRSTDDGATWVDITPPLVGERPTNDGFLAVGNRDTVYVQNVWGLTFQLFRSDDRGATWLLLPTPKLPLLMHRNWIVPLGDATLHVVMEALPPSFAPALVGGPQLPLATPNEGLWYLRSDDRGLTWTVPRQIDPVVNFAGQGNLVVSQDGQALYVLRYEDERGSDPSYERGLWYLLASEDGGATWERRDAFALTSELASAVEPLALDPTGTLYMAWSQALDGRSQLHFATSRDGGMSWSAPRLLAPSSGTQAMPWLASPASGELRVVWYEADANVTAPKADAPWFAHAARITGADTDAPAVAAQRVTPEPVHEGNICAKGPACGQGEDRRLLDYPWIVVGPDGRSHLVVASTEWDLPSAFAVYAGELPG